MQPSRDLRRLLEARAEALEGAEGGSVVLDPAGPAIYRYGGTSSPVTIVACEPCGHVALIPLLPAKAVMHWTCPNGHVWRLEPPLSILFAGLPAPAARA